MYRIALLAGLGFSLLAAPQVVRAAGSASQPSKPSGPSLEQLAVEHYNKGIEYRDKAWSYEKKAFEAKKEKDRDKNLKKAQKEFAKAVKEQLKATQKNPKFYQAFSSMGYALRKQGKHKEALNAYDMALKLEPNYPEAIEYQAEAFLGLGQVEKAQKAYEILFVRDAKLAGQLLGAIGRWAEERRGAPTEEWSLEAVGEVEQWVEQKQQRADQMGGTEEKNQSDW